MCRRSPLRGQARRATLSECACRGKRRRICRHSQRQERLRLRYGALNELFRIGYGSITSMKNDDVFYSKPLLEVIFVSFPLRALLWPIQIKNSVGRSKLQSGRTGWDRDYARSSSACEQNESVFDRASCAAAVYNQDPFGWSAGLLATERGTKERDQDESRD